MQNVQERQKMLVKVLSEETVYSQEELLSKLKLQGIETTQATLSRDLKALGVTKLPGEGYRLPDQLPRPAAPVPIDVSLQSITFSGQLAVLKTEPGFASAAATLIDKAPSWPVLGTIAGHDTVLIILRQNQSPEFVLEALAKVFPDIRAFYFPAR